MMSAQAAAIIVAVGIILPLLVVGSCMIRFDDGKVVRKAKRGSWLGKWKLLALFAAACAIASGLVETLAFGATIVTAVRWEIALAATVVSAWSDVKDRVIPNEAVLAVVVMGVLLGIFETAENPAGWESVVVPAVSGCLLGAGVFFVSRLITRGGVGFGDIKLFGALGLLLGFRPLFNVLFYTLIAAFVYAVILLVLRKGKINDRVPLGPFAFVGVVASIGFGV